ncbi:MAG TPA: hypothetical protein VNI52_00510 [Sphingobacteriaceae bacterium]|nr:hypothetical protein [Sphingobacteriaceae bacterium]
MKKRFTRALSYTVLLLAATAIFSCRKEFENLLHEAETLPQEVKWAHDYYTQTL